MNELHYVETLNGKTGYIVTIGKECYGTLQDQSGTTSLIQGKKTKMGYQFDIDESELSVIKAGEDDTRIAYHLENDLGTRALYLTDMRQYIENDKNIKTLQETVMKQFYDTLASYLDEAQQTKLIK